ncbi:hypothetical protein F528_0519 [Neisseria meningitidis 992008]|nr:hypothetical protein F528_0519 [Neisseria meningitidis 992008]
MFSYIFNDWIGMPDASDGCVLPSECDGSLSILKKVYKGEI